MSVTDKNLYAYCDNNPVMRVDNGGQFWGLFWDIVSFCSSVVEVVKNPTDPWAWAGLVGDAIDLVPVVSGVGETTRAINTGRKLIDSADDIHDAIKTADNLADVADTAKDIAKAGDKTTDVIKASDRAYAVRKAWKLEYDNVLNGGEGFSRRWNELERNELLCTGRVKGYQGHHMKSVHNHSLADARDPYNIQFLNRQDHLKAHGGNWRNPTYGRYNPD